MSNDDMSLTSEAYSLCGRLGSYFETKLVDVACQCVKQRGGTLVRPDDVMEALEIVKMSDWESEVDDE